MNNDIFFLGRDLVMSYDMHSSNDSLQMKSLTMELRTDSYPTDNSWKIEDVCSGIILMKVSRDTEYKNRNKIYIHQKYTEYSSWKLTIKDWFGNGLCCDNGDGFFTIKYGDDVVASGGSFRSKKVINFGKGNCSSSPVSLVPSLSPIVSLVAGSPLSSSAPTINQSTAPSLLSSSVPTLIGSRLPSVVTESNSLEASEIVAQNLTSNPTYNPTTKSSSNISINTTMIDNANYINMIVNNGHCFSNFKVIMPQLGLLCLILMLV